jgi:DNA polymerase type B, organellar and viral
MKFGYKFKILRGYTFDSEFILTEYVDKIYYLKSSVSPGDPIYRISKLLLIYLYGRFGMSPESENHIIISNDNEQFLLDYKILNVLDLNNGNSLLTYKMKETSQNTNLNISIPIASSISAMARV